MRWLFWAALPVAAIAGCSAAGGGVNNQAPPSTSSAGGTSSSPAAGSGAAPSSTTVRSVACDKPELGKPVLRLLNRAEFARSINAIFPQVTGSWNNTLPADPVAASGFDNDAATVVGPQLAQAMLDTGTSVASAVTGTALATILPCSTSAATRACAEQFVNQYGRRFFRRSLTPVEHDRYLAFFDAALPRSDFKTALKWLTVGLIQSPNAVYRSEIGTVASDGTRQLTGPELATELAYTYTATTPTDELLTQAEGGGALDATSLAKTLLHTDAGKATLQHFFESYLDYARVAAIERAGVPNFNAVRGDMIQETRGFIDQVVLQSGGGLRELLTAGTSNPSIALAAYYGFPAPAADYAPVTRNAGQGIGVLAQGSILASRAQPNGSSPTQRGLLVFSRFLCNVKPSPPPNVGNVPELNPGKVTTRQRYEMVHAKDGACPVCHKLFDPIGFGFEHFDEGGRYRADESGLPIDTVSQVPAQDGSVLFPFTDEETLAKGLAEQPVVYQCFAAYLATYAYGTSDSCLGASGVAGLKAGTVGIADYYAGLAAEPHFTHRASQ